jgi:hypothetical protein
LHSALQNEGKKIQKVTVKEQKTVDEIKEVDGKKIIWPNSGIQIMDVP